MKAKTATIVTADQLAKKIENATMGLIPSFSRRLVLSSPKHIPVICDYIIALRSEIKFSDAYRQSILATLMLFSRTSKKDFKDFTRADVITYLDQYRKQESQDPTHKWIGTYNARLVNIIKFFRWLYYPDIEPTKRPKPGVVQNLHKLRRREISGYKPSDMWDVDDNLIFLKYCPSSRDRCYHTMEIDTGARPHELLGLRIKDVEFIEEGGNRYAKIVVNGKTGERSLALIDSIPYVTQWISNHPQGSNREAILLPNIKTGKAIQVNAIFRVYKNYKKYFTSLLSSRDIPEDDKKRITELLRKPWNPYVHRHSALTEKSGLLSSDINLRQFAGWSISSNMHKRYVHFRGGESMKDLLRARGIIKDEKQSINILQPKSCPNCRELNKPDAQFCFKCNFVMSFEAYQKGMEERQKKDNKILELEEQITQMQQGLKLYAAHAKELTKEVFEKAKKEIDEYRKELEEKDQRRDILFDMLDEEVPGWGERYHRLLGWGGRPLNKKEREKANEFLEMLKNAPPDDYNDEDD